MSIVAAILVAAGPGSRLGAEQPKAFVDVAGTPLLVLSLRSLLAAETIASVVVVVPPGEIDRGRALLDRHGPWPRAVGVVEGGAERRDSVRLGLGAVTDADLIVIHDAARPFVSCASIEAAISAAEHHGAAIVAVPATDTVKQVHPNGWIESTPRRDRIWLAQTPQVFRSAVIRAAHAQPITEGDPATDDAMLVEQLGTRVYVVPGDPENRKITTPDDLRWAASRVARSDRS